MRLPARPSLCLVTDRRRYHANRALLPRTTEVIERLPTLIQHGRADEMIPLSRAKESLEHLRELNVPVTFREYDCGHEITASSLEDLSEFLIKKVL